MIVNNHDQVHHRAQAGKGRVPAFHRLGRALNKSTC